DKYIAGDKVKKKPTLIVGAGDAGAMLARQLNTENNDSELYPTAFVDDDMMKQRMQVYNIPVVGRVQEIPDVVEQRGIEHIIVAIPSLKNGELNRIIDYANEAEVPVQMLPKIEDLASGRVSVSHLKNIEVEDLLGREPVLLDNAAIQSTITGETVMVTGAGGSIGSEICRQLIQFQPERILLVGHGGFSIYSIDMELKKMYGHSDTEVVPIIGDVKDKR